MQFSTARGIHALGSAEETDNHTTCGLPARLRWRAENKATLVEVGVLGDDCQPMLGRVPPDDVVIGRRETNIADVRGTGVQVSEVGKQAGRQILVEQEPHAGGTDTNRRSRSAANARHARMSSRVRSGKSRRMASSVTPEARYSSTSDTVMRSQRQRFFSYGTCHGLKPAA